MQPSVLLAFELQNLQVCEKRSNVQDFVNKKVVFGQLGHRGVGKFKGSFMVPLVLIPGK